MRTRPDPADPTADLIWLCRRLASALHGGAKPVSALDAVAAEAPPSLAKTIKAMRGHLASGDCMGRGLAQLGLPSYIWGAIFSGEVCGELEQAATLLADRLELERSLPPPANPRRHSLSLAFGRLGLLLALHAPMLTALEAAAESLPDPKVRSHLLAAREAVTRGADLADALAQLAPDLPPMTLDMIRDAERDGRLPEALPVIADYLLDVAADKPVRRAHKEVRHG